MNPSSVTAIGLRPIDLVRMSARSLTSRPLRTSLTALGISIGIAALVAVVGISSSSKADVLAELDRIGTNLLQVRAGQSVFGEEASLSIDSVSMARRIGPVQGASATAGVSGATVRRTDLIDAAETAGIAVVAADLELLETVAATVDRGRWLDAATERAPAVVLGATAARRLGITTLTVATLVWIGERWWTVVGVLDPIPLLATLDSAAMVGFPAANRWLDHDGGLSSIYVRTDPDRVVAVRDVLAPTVHPSAPNEVEISRPSDALAAKATVDARLRAMLLGLGGVALIVGGIGIANVMVISVLERRTEIGVRRAVGATRRHIRLAFVVEAALLAALGGLGGAGLGAGVTALYARHEGLPLVLPPSAVLGGVAAAVAVGVLGGVLPAARAARLTPVEALRPT